MGKCKLFDFGTWKRDPPKPFDDIVTKYDAVKSKYSPPSASSTLHAATLRAILAYMALDHASEMTGSDGEPPKGAIGTQADNFVIAEYPSRTGLTHVVVFNNVTGKFTAAKMADADASPKPYALKDKGDSGAALFFALMPKALEDEEFTEEYAKLWDCCKAGYPDVDDAALHAAVLCDNLYRRIENPAGCGAAGIRVRIPASGNIQPFTPLALSQGTYNPTSKILGEFAIMEPGRAVAKKARPVKAEAFVGQYQFSAAPLSAAEEAMVPQLPSWYVIPEEVALACRYAKETTGSAQPMRNFMFRGPAGTGKTEGAKAFAAGIHRPYVSLTCNANYEIYDFLGQMMPDVAQPGSNRAVDLPSLQDIQMDPASAYCGMTGEYRADVTEEDVFNKLLEVMAARAKAEQPSQSRQSFRYVDTPFVQALRYGYVVELQEPTVIANPGVMVGLNSLLDRCSAITLPTGEVIQRHPDCVVIVTTNIGYEGCRDMNQSVLSRMNLIIDFDQPDAATMTARVSKITGCEDKSAIRQMVECMGEVIRCCQEKSITDGSCGMRELIAWVQSFMIEHDILAAARYTVLSAVSSDPENREEILSSCLLPRFNP